MTPIRKGFGARVSRTAGHLRERRILVLTLHVLLSIVAHGSGNQCSSTATADVGGGV